MRTLLIAGLGDIAMRAMPYLTTHWRVLALCHHAAAARRARLGGAVPVSANLDDANSLRRLAGLADDVLITAPPPNHGVTDPRTRKLLYALTKGLRIPQRVSYISTSGVYGNADGNWLDETAPTNPGSDRARRRLDAEHALRAFAIATGAQVRILRAPGIYAAERLPIGRLLSATPLIRPEEDSLSNHIHADDLARLCIATLHCHSGGLRIYNACDDEPLPVGQWYARLAEKLHVAVPPCYSREDVRRLVSPMLWSFLAESRRLCNNRLKRELGVELAYPSVQTLLDQLPDSDEFRAALLASGGQIR